VAVDDVITTPQDRLLLGLNGLGVSQGGFFLPTTSLPVDFSTPGLPPTNSLPPPIVSRSESCRLIAWPWTISSRAYRTATASLVHKMARMTISLTGYGTVRDYLLPLPGFDARQTIYGADLGVTRKSDAGPQAPRLRPIIRSPMSSAASISWQLYPPF